MKRTASKKPSAAERESDRWLDWEDAMLNHCRTLDTLAELLANTGRNRVVELEMVNNTGGLMKEEVARLKKLSQARPGREATR
jgi:hypothetical protein